MGIKIENKFQQPELGMEKKILGYHTCPMCKEPFKITIDQKAIEQTNTRFFLC